PIPLQSSIRLAGQFPPMLNRAAESLCDAQHLLDPRRTAVHQNAARACGEIVREGQGDRTANVRCLTIRADGGFAFKRRGSAPGNAYRFNREFGALAAAAHWSYLQQPFDPGDFERATRAGESR